MRVVAFVAAVLVGAGPVDALVEVGASETGQPVPLAGLPLSGTSHLHLLVADNPPFVVDVDTGRFTPLRAPVAMRHGVLWVTAAAGDAGVIVAGHPKGQIYGVGARRARLIFLGRGSAVVPSSAGRSVWIKSKAGSACRLRQVALDGHQIGQASSLACSATIESAGSLGLVYSRVRVVDPLTGRTLLRTRYGVIAAAGNRLVLAGPGRRFTLLNTATGSQKKLAWPSVLTGLDAPSADDQGRRVALAFANPAWAGTGKQALDVWILDTRTGGLSHLPGMPTFVDLKFTSMDWTTDGRLVILGETDHEGFVAVWRPGAAKLRIKRLRLPERTSGSDSFASLR
jgi:hypothetical protein